MKTNQKLSVLFFLKRKKLTADGKAPIYVRLTIDSRSNETSLSLKCHPNEWDITKKKVKGNSVDVKNINVQLEQAKASIGRLFLILGAQHEKVTLAALMKAFRTPKNAKSHNVGGQAKEANFGKLKENIDDVSKKAFTYFAEVKKAKKIRNEIALNHRMSELDTIKRLLTNEVEKLVSLANAHFAATDIKWTTIDASYEFLLFYLRKVLSGHRSITTFRRWTMTKDKVKSFVWYHYKKTTFPLDDMTVSFANNMYEYLTNVDGCGHNISMKYIKNFKQVLNRTLVNGWILSNPIQSFKCSYIQPDIDPIVMDQIISLINSDLGHKLNEVKDAFLFSCFTGYAYEEACNLTPGHIFIGIDGKKWIGIDRTKTDGPEKIPLLPIAAQIVEKYKDHPCRAIDDRLIPVYSNQYYNRLLKRVAIGCGIKNDLTTHIARHTFATTITLENDVPLPTVSKMLGHRSIRTTERYAKVTQKKISRNMSRLETLLFDANGNLLPIQ